MTTKELLYVDDALSHVQLLAAQYQDAANRLQDASLRATAQQMAERHRQTYRKLYGLM